MKTTYKNTIVSLTLPIPENLTIINDKVYVKFENQRENIRIFFSNPKLIEEHIRERKHVKYEISFRNNKLCIVGAAVQGGLSKENWGIEPDANILNKLKIMLEDSILDLEELSKMRNFISFLEEEIKNA